jgi:hypothetical protein
VVIRQVWGRILSVWLTRLFDPRDGSEGEPSWSLKWGMSVVQTNLANNVFTVRGRRVVDERELEDLHFWRDGFKGDLFTSVCTCGGLQDIRDTIVFKIYAAKSVILRLRCEFIASQRFPMERPAKRKNGKIRTTRHFAWKRLRYGEGEGQLKTK